MGNSLAARAWYPRCHPFVFLFWGCPGPQSWDDPSLPLCREHEGEGGGGSLGPLNSQLAIPLLFSLTSIKIQNNDTMTRRVVAWKLLNCLQVRCIRRVERDPTLLLDELIDLKEPHIYLQQLYFRRSGLTLIVSRLLFWTLVNSYVGEESGCSDCFCFRLQQSRRLIGEYRREDFGLWKNHRGKHKVVIYFLLQSLVFFLHADMQLRYHIKSPLGFHKIPIKLQNGFGTGVEVLQCGENDGSGSSASITSALSLVKYTKKAEEAFADMHYVDPQVPTPLRSWVSH